MSLKNRNKYIGTEKDSETQKIERVKSKICYGCVITRFFTPFEKSM